MAIDFVLEFPCAVRKSLGESALVTMVGHRTLAEFAVTEVRRTNPSLDLQTILEKVQVRVSQARPDGTTEQVPMTVGQLAALGQPLDPHRAQCGPCRANIADRSFGCIAKINYPIRKESEEWLLSRLAADGNDPGMALLFKLLSDFGLDGRSVDEMRPKLFELKEPLVRQWGTFSGRKKVSSSQIIQMLILGDIGPQQAQAYTHVLALERVLKDPHPASDNIEQFKTFMCAVVMSARLNAILRVNA
ncbi:hypothetical protein C7S18_15805 [Ahniella affigens]|uniref:Uncharacterized protein n=1 Tax=Ahniella affigens TaxID=2021234 RepID=A0A2P1PUR5_9GAMM|nr:hypothetical protein [Ahniella affigens]AVP98560.1 hypothetical protein C7S18_15805 [Ahniella affigens]